MRNINYINLLWHGTALNSHTKKNNNNNNKNNKKKIYIIYKKE